MSRLDSVIRRLEAQRACLNRACEAVAGQPGAVFELGLGNGRTYDHLRQQLPDREIYVFEREIRAHPDCIPDDDHLFVGDLKETLPAAAEDFARRVAMIHSDIGTGDPDRNARFAAWLGDAIQPLLAPGAIVLSDQELTALAPLQQPLPPGVQEGRYFIYRWKD